MIMLPSQVTVECLVYFVLIRTRNQSPHYLLSHQGRAMYLALLRLRGLKVSASVLSSMPKE